MKTVVVTGASSGIGLGLTEAYLKKGFNVVANARTKERLKKAADQLGSPSNLLTVAGDIGLKSTAERIVQEAMAKFGHVDILINNAGIFKVKPFADYTPEELDSFINTNLKGFVYISQLASTQMAKQGHGHIVNITAAIAMQPNVNVPASIPILIKGGLNSVTKALAVELAPKNIKVNAVAPGIIDTPLYTPDMHEFLNTLQPVGRIGKVKDVVDAIMYLTDAEFTTGAVLSVDGGMSAGK